MIEDFFQGLVNSKLLEEINQAFKDIVTKQCIQIHSFQETNGIFTAGS